MRPIPRLFIASSVLLALCVRPCDAAFPQVPGFDLAWHDCIGLPGAAQNLDYACDGSRDGNPFRLVLTITPPVDIPQFVGLQALVDMRTESARLPDWWRLGTGECREGMLAFPGSRAGIGTGATGECRDPWPGAQLGGGYQWSSEDGGYPPTPSPRPGWGILKLAFARDNTTVLSAGQRYIAGVITLDPSAIRRGGYGDPIGDPDSCLGCATPACIAVNQIELFQPAGQTPPQQDIIVLTIPIERQFVTWQGGEIGGSGCPAAVPVRRTTWGAIKAIYR